MDVKKFNGTSWETTPSYVYKTATDTLSLPATIYADGTAATIGLKGNMEQSGTPTPTNPIQPSECGDMTGNLFDISVIQTEGTRNYYLTEDGTETSGSGWFITQYIPVNGNSITISGPAGINPSICAYDENKQYLRGKKYNGNNATISIQDAKFVRFSLVPTSEVHQKAMLNYGTTILPYEPYGYKIPISSANTTTPVYLGEVETTRKIKKLVLTGGEVTTVDAPVGQALISVSKVLGVEPVSSHYVGKVVTAWAQLSDGEVGLVNNGYTIRICDTTHATSVPAFNNYLTQQYANGTPVTIWYVLSSATTGIVNEPLQKIGNYADEVSGITIPTIAGANTISVDTTLQPSEVSVNYKGWHPVQSVHERENGAWD